MFFCGVNEWTDSFLIQFSTERVHWSDVLVRTGWKQKDLSSQVYILDVEPNKLEPNQEAVSYLKSRSWKDTLGFHCHLTYDPPTPTLTSHPLSPQDQSKTLPAQRSKDMAIYPQENGQDQGEGLGVGWRKKFLTGAKVCIKSWACLASPNSHR